MALFVLQFFVFFESIHNLELQSGSFKKVALGGVLATIALFVYFGHIVYYVYCVALSHIHCASLSYVHCVALTGISKDSAMVAIP